MSCVWRSIHHGVDWISLRKCRFQRSTCIALARMHLYIYLCTYMVSTGSMLLLIDPLSPHPVLAPHGVSCCKAPQLTTGAHMVAQEVAFHIERSSHPLPLGREHIMSNSDLLNPCQNAKYGSRNHVLKHSSSALQ